MDKHTRIGSALAFTLSVASLALVVFAFTPATPAAFEPDVDPIAYETSVARPVVSAPVELAPVTFPKSATVAKAVAVKARKRICDDRGNTYMHGYARPVETRIVNETTARVCWTE